MTVDPDGPIDDVEVTGFDGLLAVVEHAGTYVGRVTLPADRLARDGRIAGETIRREVRTALWRELWAAALRERLHRRIASQWWEHVPHASVTVAVCTRDRPGHLARCLAALARLDPPPDRVLVVDNAPRLPCRAAVEAHGFDYVLEPRPGLDNARNRAIEQCQTDLIAFTDDDCVPVPAWLARLDRHFSDLSTGAVTGWANALRLESEAQIAFEDTGGFTRGFRLRRFDWGTVHPTAAGVTGAGANMTFRTDLLREVGGFPPELDAGTPTASGGDVYVLGRVLAAGARIVFDPASLVWHDHRADVAELRRVLRGYGLGIGAMASRALVVDGEIRALNAYAWPFQELYRALRASHRSGGSDLAVVAAAEQARGALAAPYRWGRSLRDVRGRSPSSLGRSPQQAIAEPVPSSRSRPASEPEVSVVVPTVAGREAILARCIERLGRQTLERGRYEIIVVRNGGGTRATGGVSGADRTLDVGEPGAARARNAGAEAARARVLVFLDDDVLAESTCLAAHLARQHARPGVVLGPAYPARSRQTLATQASARWWLDHYSRKHRPGHRFTFVDCLTGNLGIDRELFDAVGGLDPAFAAHRREDWELGVRLLQRGEHLAAAPEAVAFHHHAPTVRRLVADARREGYGDVLLAGRHPIVVADLRLDLFSDGRLAGRRWRRVVAVGRGVTDRPTAAAVRGLAALERANLRRGWSIALRRLLTAAYCAGVQAALDDGHRIPRGARARTRIDVDSDAPIEFTTALGEIMLVVGGQEVGHVLAPDGQWDEDEIIERAIDALGLPALAAEARGLRQ